jgi:hypothetical protein
VLDADVGHKSFDHDRELPVIRDAESLLQGAMRKSLEPMATIIYSIDSDEDDEVRSAATPEKKKGVDRFKFMSGNRDLSLDVTQVAIDIAEKKWTQADSQDICNTMIDAMHKIV